ncbi:Ribosomal protein L6 [Rickettsiales bacterium Ac37b]|nr:Ribosomal protein L6 [Rickettsiales bacterium Ac37b]
MSRVGKMPITVPPGVKVNLEEGKISVIGNLGQLAFKISNKVKVNYDHQKQELRVLPVDESMDAKAMWGLSRSLIYNLVHGVSVGFVVKLEMNGVGYRCAVDKLFLTLFLGFSHEIKYAIPSGIQIKSEKPTSITITGVDKQKVGQVAAEIRKLRPPEPYKAKGIKYENERIRRKIGKKK